MRRWLPAALALALWAAPAGAQVPRGMQGRRAELMERIHERFVDEIAERLGLDEAQQERVSTILRETMERRRELARASMRVRLHFFAAVQDSGTATGELERLMTELRELREQEFGLANEEEEALSEVLTVRQLAEFLYLRHRFNQRVQELRGGGRMGPPGSPRLMDGARLPPGPPGGLGG